jgi:proton-translocating NAD(P)+ transhydrogenase subunit alpha
VTTFLLHMVKDGELALDTEDEIVAGTLLTRDGEVVHPALREAPVAAKSGSKES